MYFWLASLAAAAETSLNGLLIVAPPYPTLLGQLSPGCLSFRCCWLASLAAAVETFLNGLLIVAPPYRTCSRLAGCRSGSGFAGSLALVVTAA
jgi:hypothetical protein